MPVLVQGELRPAGTPRFNPARGAVLAHREDIHLVIYHLLSLLAYAAAFWLYLHPEVAGIEGSWSRAAFVGAAAIMLGWISGINVGVVFHNPLYFKALDDAAFFAVNSVVEDVFVLTASFNLHLLRPIAAGEMRAKGTLVHRSQRLFLAESEIKDAEGRLLARGSGTFARSTIALGPEIGYR